MSAASRRLAALTADTVPLHPDARMIRTWLDTRPDLDPIALSIGDPGFSAPNVPGRLRDLLAEAPDHTHGYQYSMYGLPAARHLIGDHVIADQGLAESATPGNDFDLAVTSHGTRAAIHDFGRWLLRQHPDDPRTPLALCATPSWDYAGVLEPAGYRMAHWPLRPEAGWWPHAEDLRDALTAIDADQQQRLAMVIINAQHNPTGRSWPGIMLRELIDAAHRRGAGILIDDAYYAVRTTDRHAAAQSAPRHLLAVLDTARRPSFAARRHWCAVRSLGKQFGVNGWGVGTITAHPDTLRELTECAFQRSFPTGADRQWAMAHWVADAASGRWMAAQRQQLTVNRDLLTDALTGPLRWPTATVVGGECGPYALIRIPLAYQTEPDGPARWRRDLFDATGVLLSPASIEQPQLPTPYLRIYLGTSTTVLAGALQRIRAAGITYDQPAATPPAAPPAATVDPGPHLRQARTRQRAAQLLHRLAGTTHHPSDEQVVDRIADWFRPAWLAGDHRPDGTCAAAAAILDAVDTARWDHQPGFLDAIHAEAPLRVPDRASVLLRAIAEHTHPDSAPELAAAATVLALDTHRAVDDALGAHLHTLAMNDPAGAPGPAPVADRPRPPTIPAPRDGQR